LAKNCFKNFVRKCSSIEDYRNTLIDSMKLDDLDLKDIEILLQNDKAVFLGMPYNFVSKEDFCLRQAIAVPRLTGKEESAIAINDSVPKLNFKNALLHFEASS
jgi:hypothetical protein